MALQSTPVFGKKRFGSGVEIACISLFAYEKGIVLD
jgi:hypothetical protein